jgi:hypothetical protein
MELSLSTPWPIASISTTPAPSTTSTITYPVKPGDQAVIVIDGHSQVRRNSQIMTFFQSLLFPLPALDRNFTSTVGFFGPVTAMIIRVRTKGLLIE